MGMSCPDSNAELLSTSYVRHYGFGDTHVVAWPKNHLGSANSGGNGDGVPQLDGFIGKDWKSLLGAQHGHAAANISGQRQQLFDRHKFHFAVAGGRRQGLEVKLSIGRDDGKTEATAIAARQ